MLMTHVVLEQALVKAELCDIRNMLLRKHFAALDGGSRCMIQRNVRSQMSLARIC